MNKLTKLKYVEEYNDFRAVPGTLTIRKWKGMTLEYINLLEELIVECLIHQMRIHNSLEEDHAYWVNDERARYFSYRISIFMKRSHPILRTPRKQKRQYSFEAQELNRRRTMLVHAKPYTPKRVESEKKVGKGVFVGQPEDYDINTDSGRIALRSFYVYTIKRCIWFTEIAIDVIRKRESITRRQTELIKEFYQMRDDHFSDPEIDHSEMFEYNKINKTIGFTSTSSMLFP
jgi:hypothetical protein